MQKAYQLDPTTITLDVITENLAVTLGPSLSESLERESGGGE
jgi:hypothetical protein